MRISAHLIFALAIQSASAQWNPDSLAGDYRSSTGFEVWRLELHANGTANYSWAPDHPGGQSYNGKWKLENDLVIVKLVGKSRQGARLYRTWQFVPLKWGQRLYLISEDEVRDFAGQALWWQDANRDLRSQQLEFHAAPLMRDLDKKPRRFGAPQAPPAYQVWFDWRLGA